MKTITLTEEQAQQIEEVLSGMLHGTDWNNGTHAKIYRPKFPEALATIRAARAQEQAEQEPLLWGDDKFAPHERPQEQEPVAWMQIGIGDCEGTTILTARLPTEYNTEWWKFEPLYAAPVRTKDLTDDEIMDLVRDECVDMRWPSTPLFIARSVIAAYKEKEKHK